MQNWSGDKLLSTIILNERKANELYRYFAEESKDSKEETLFLELAQDEQRHESIYEEIRQKYNKVLNIANLDDEYADYLDIMLINNIFSGDLTIDEEIRRLLKKHTFLEAAEKIETDAILYILELQKLYPELAINEIDTILREERKHLNKVFTLKIQAGRKLND